MSGKQINGHASTSAEDQANKHHANKSGGERTVQLGPGVHDVGNHAGPQQSSVLLRHDRQLRGA